MQDTQQTRSPLLRRLLIACGVVLILVAVGAVTVLLLKSVIPKKETAGNMATILKANEVVALYSVPGVIKGLSDSLYDQQLNDANSTVPVVYKLDSHSYVANTQTSNNVLFYSKTSSPQNDTEAIQNQTTVFMHDKGYEKVSNPVTIDSKSVTRVTYADAQSVCQLTSSAAVTSVNSPASHQLACTDKTVIDEEYVAIEKLLDLYAGKKPSFTEAYRQTEREDNKAFTILRLSADQKTSKLLFAAVDDKWAYLGNLSGTDGVPNAKYVISPEIKAKISDAKYGSFLTKNLQGQSSS